MTGELSVQQNRISTDEKNLLYLISCAVNQEKPDSEKCSAMDVKAVFELSNGHMLTIAAGTAFRTAAPLPNYWAEARGNLMRRFILFESERAKVIREFENRGIWYFLLKGIILKDYYPSAVMREMADNDILCDSEKMDEVSSLMKELGYTFTEYDVDNHDVYQKSPMSFEMHRTLFNRFDFPEIYAYYKSIKDRLIKDEDNGFGYHMSDDDFYIYIICHMYKHFARAGTGLRSLLDVYVINKKKGASLNRDYIGSELDKLGIREYEEYTRRLAEKVFTNQPLTDDEEKNLSNYLNSKCYGSEKNLIAHKMHNDDSKQSKRRYLLRRIFPDEAYLERYYPTVYRQRILYPFLVIIRPFKGITTKPKKLFNEYKIVKNYKNHSE